MNRIVCRNARSGMLPTSLLALILAGPIPGQSIPERHQVFLLDTCGADRSVMPCDLLRQVAAVITLPGRDATWRAMQQVEAAINKSPSDSRLYYALGLLRWQAHSLAIPSQSRLLQDLGESQASGSGNALLKALQLDSTFVAAALALAAAPLPREGHTRLQERAVALERRHSLLDAEHLALAAGVQREARRREVAIATWREALDRKHGAPGLVQLELARDLFAQGSAAAASEVYFAGATDTAPGTVAAYSRALRWVASPEEFDDWVNTTPTLRADWLAAFWASRDVSAGWATGTRLAEHFRRVEYALEHYRIQLPQSGRQRARSTARAGDFLWDELALQDVRRTIGTTAESEEATGLVQFLDGDALTMGSGSMLATYQAEQTLVDDRGVVHIRHGPPDASARSVGGVALELWRYDHPDGEMVLAFKEVDFDGQVGASALVPTVLSEHPLMRDQLCHLKVTLCSMNADPRGSDATVGLGRVSREAARYRSGTTIASERDQGLAAIATATQSDTHLPEVVAPLRAVGQIYALRSLVSGAPQLVAAFAVDVAGIVPERPVAAEGRFVYPIRLTLAAASRRNGARIDHDTLRQFASARALAAGEFLTGVLELPISTGAYSASLRLRAAGDRTAVLSLPRLGGEYLDGLWLSDLVVGDPNGRHAWQSGTTRVALNPLNTLSRQQEAEIYLQLAGLSEGEEYFTRVEMVEAGRADREASLRLRFTGRATSALHEIQSRVGLGNLASGQYTMRVQVEVRGRVLVSEARLSIVN